MNENVQCGCGSTSRNAGRGYGRTSPGAAFCPGDCHMNGYGLPRTGRCVGHQGQTPGGAHSNCTGGCALGGDGQVCGALGSNTGRQGCGGRAKTPERPIQNHSGCGCGCAQARREENHVGHAGCERPGCPGDAALLEKLQALDFALCEVTLFLNAYPKDCQALELYHRLRRQWAETADEYERRVGPLTHRGNTDETGWHWVDQPFPWDVCANP